MSLKDIRILSRKFISRGTEEHYFVLVLNFTTFNKTK